MPGWMDLHGTLDPAARSPERKRSDGAVVVSRSPGFRRGLLCGCDAASRGLEVERQIVGRACHLDGQTRGLDAVIDRRCHTRDLYNRDLYNKDRLDPGRTRTHLDRLVTHPLCFLSGRRADTIRR